jgi:hypothetical protein
VLSCGFEEGGEHDRCGDPVTCGHLQGVVGMVIEPGQHLDVSARAAIGSSESVVSEVGLPGRPFGQLRSDQPCANEDAADRRARDADLVAMLEVPANRVCSGIQAGLPQHQ